MEILTTLHGHNRWLIVIFALLAIVFLILNRKDSTEYKKSTKFFGSLYAYFLVFQFLIGLLLFFPKAQSLNWDMSVLRIQFEHATTMILAIGIAHSAAAWKKLEPSKRINNTLIAYVVSLGLIFLGVIRIGGLSLWTGS
ncbi:MAG: hypothetical protein EBU66_02140 [Bacteroidetes bacterium]|nr:hypothetical protein [bacterium]NBP63473.1 hypothetical protein [Bacteroidota bacterium]